MTAADLTRLDDRPEVIQFGSALTDSEYKFLGEWFREHPEKTLRAYASYDGTITDLEFLRHFPTLRRFQADALFNSLINIDGLAYLPENLEFIGLGRTKKRLSVAALARFSQLRRLYIEGHTKDLDVVSELTDLRSVTLRSVTLPDLSLLTPLRKLRALDLKLGGTNDLALLPELQSLEYLELWMVKGLSDLSPISELGSLEYLFLQSLRQVDALPAMDNLVSLGRLWLETMKGLTELTPVRTAPALRQLAVVDMAHLQPEAFAPLVGHRTLQSYRAGLGSKRKNDAVEALVGLPRADDGWQKPVGV